MAEKEGPGEWVPNGASVLPDIPPELGVNPMFLAVLHAIVFLEGSEDDVVDPDAAMEVMEYMASYLQRLGKPEFHRLREDLAALEAYARAEKWPKEQQQFFKEFLDTFGVGEEDEE